MAERRLGFAYLDIETSGLDSGSHAVIAAAVQPMNAHGPQEPEPTLLTSWSLGGEEGVLQALVNRALFIADGPRAYDLIPVGASLDFTLAFAADRLRITGAEPWSEESTTRFLSNKPRVDLKGALVLMNRGSIEGADVRRFTRRKVGSGSDVVRMYADGDFAGIETYIRSEAAAFFDVFPEMSKRLRALGDEMRPVPRPKGAAKR